MKGSVKILFAAAVVMCAAVISSFGQAGDSMSKAEQEVRKLERLWLDAYEKHDAVAMNAIVADDFTITFNDGEVMTKPQVVDSLKKSVTTSKFVTEDVRSRLYGDTVILVGTVISEWKQDGEADDTQVALHGHLRKKKRKVAGRSVASFQRPETVTR